MLIAPLGHGFDEGLGPSLLRLVGRVPQALSHSPVGTSFASIADVTRPKQRAKAFGSPFGSADCAAGHGLVPPCRT